MNFGYMKSLILKFRDPFVVIKHSYPELILTLSAIIYFLVTLEMSVNVCNSFFSPYL